MIPDDSDRERLVFIQSLGRDILFVVKRCLQEYPVFKRDASHIRQVRRKLSQIGELTDTLSPELKNKTERNLPYDTMQSWSEWRLETPDVLALDAFSFWCYAINEIPSIVNAIESILEQEA